MRALESLSITEIFPDDKEEAEDGSESVVHRFDRVTSNLQELKYLKLALTPRLIHSFVRNCPKLEQLSWEWRMPTDKVSEEPEDFTPLYAALEARRHHHDASADGTTAPVLVLAPVTSSDGLEQMGVDVDIPKPEHDLLIVLDEPTESETRRRIRTSYSEPNDLPQFWKSAHILEVRLINRNQSDFTIPLERVTIHYKNHIQQ